MTTARSKLETAPEPVHVHVAIAGSGFGGLGTAVRLGQAGFHDYVVLERADDVGGVWRDNTYPGCACDVESHLYSFSFARNPHWSSSFSPSAEIHAYLRDCAARFGVLPNVRFGHAVTRATWSDDAQRWTIETTRGTFTASIFVTAVGALSEASVPALPGLASFAGTTFHSARWNHEHSLAGRRVAVIGTGASAIQFVPHVQKEAAHLSLFQRTAPWVMPRNARPIAEAARASFAGSNARQWLERARLYVSREALALAFFEPRIAKIAQRQSLRHLERHVKDPVLRAKLTPSYTLGCKRILLSDDYLPAVAQENVDVVTDPIAGIEAAGVRTKDGVLHEVDTIIFGTGFKVQSYPFGELVRGRSGATLAETWKDGMTAHLGTTVAGFPNLFLIQGPNTALGHSSVITMFEAQIEHIVRAATHMREHGLTSVEPTAAAQQAFVAEVDAKMKGTVWTSGGCQSWYLDARGRNSAIWPGFTFSFMRRVRRFDVTDYVTVTRRERRPSAKVETHAPTRSEERVSP
ncbi:MAG: 4-hydroxyacetophenone monooxygenase [Labilithrix sp.]|nr:4-hydroxyacetophenone monooxygenase [Labilithrix sp.]